MTALGTDVPGFISQRRSQEDADLAVLKHKALYLLSASFESLVMCNLIRFGFGSVANPDHVTHVRRLLHKLYLRLESPRM